MVSTWADLERRSQAQPDVPPGERYENRVLVVVVEGIGIGNALDCQARIGLKDFGKAAFRRAKRALELGRQVVAKGIRCESVNREHRFPYLS